MSSKGCGSGGESRAGGRGGVWGTLLAVWLGGALHTVLLVLVAGVFEHVCGGYRWWCVVWMWVVLWVVMMVVVSSTGAYTVLVCGVWGLGWRLFLTTHLMGPRCQIRALVETTGAPGASPCAVRGSAGWLPVAVLGEVLRGGGGGVNGCGGR